MSCTIIQGESQKYLEYRVFVTDEFANPEPLVEQDDRIIVSRGNIAAIIGKPKAFKTFLTSAIAAGVFKNDILGISGNCQKVLFIDTEQSKSHVNKVQKRIYKLCDWDLNTSKDNLIMLALRESSPEDRSKIVLDTIESWKPDLVILDGIRDLVKDFNSIEESSGIIGDLMAITTKCNCGIITVLHQNKADNNARGHLGTELCNKSETVLQVVNDNSIATVSPVYSRNEEIEPFSFRIDTSGLPVECNAPNTEKKTLELKSLMQKVMQGSYWLEKKELEARLQKEEGKSPKTANRRIKDALDKGIIKYNKTNHIILATNEGIDEGEIPF